MSTSLNVCITGVQSALCATDVMGTMVAVGDGMGVAVGVGVAAGWGTHPAISKRQVKEMSFVFTACPDRYAG
jgi:hypothetical protein